MTPLRRKRRIAADEAHSWARNLRLRNPYAKLVLCMLTLYVNGDGCCFTSIEQLAEDCEFAAETVRRRLIWLESVGAIVRLPQWRDSSGRLNSDGRGKRTTDEIRLMVDIDPEAIEAAAQGETEGVEETSTSETPEISHPPRRVANEEPETDLAPHLATQQPPSCGGDITSEPEPLNSPQPPPGESVASLEGWKEFQEDWAEPILRQSLAQQVWAALKPDERMLARQAARGYVLHRKSQKKPPNVLGAHIFLKERDAWAGFAKLAPDGRTSRSAGITADSTEGRAIIAMYAIAKTRPFEGRGGIVYPGEITAQVLAFAEAPEQAKWIWFEDSPQISAWSKFLDKHVHGNRPSLVTTRGIGGDTGSGFYAPWPWPPSAEGKIYTTGPPESLMQAEDFSEFK